MLFIYCFIYYYLLILDLLLLLFSRSVMSDSLGHQRLQYARLPCPSPSPWTCLDSCPSSRWHDPTISSSVIPFISHFQSFPESGSFQRPESALHIRWPKYWSFSFNISPSNEYSGLISVRMDWLDLLTVQGTLKSLLQHHSSKASILLHSAFFIFQLTSIRDYWKNHSFDYMDLCQQKMSLLFNMLSRLVIAFLSRSKPLLISWLQSPSGVILEPKKIKSISVSIVSQSICHEVMGPDAMRIIFWMLSFKPDFSLSSFTFIKRPFSSSHFLP